MARIRALFSKFRPWLSRNYWWVGPGLGLVLFFAFGLIYQTNIKSNQVRQDIPITNSDLTLNVAYPETIPYDSAGPVGLSVWVSCNDPCAETPLPLVIRTANSLLIAQDIPEPQWSRRLAATLQPDQGAVRALLIRKSEPGLITYLKVRVGTFQEIQLPGIRLESLASSRWRIFWTELWSGAGLAVTIMLTIFGWVLKQRQDGIERRKIDSIKYAEELSSLLKKESLFKYLVRYRQLLPYFNRLEKEQRIELRREFTEILQNPADFLRLLSLQFRTSLAAGTSTLNMSAEIIKGEHYFPDIPGLQLSYIDKLQQAVSRMQQEVPDEQTKNQVEIETLNIVFDICKTYPNAANDILVVLLDNCSQLTRDQFAAAHPDYLQAHGQIQLVAGPNSPVPYTSEEFPFARQIAQDATLLPFIEQPLSKWLETHSAAFTRNPFADFSSPLQFTNPEQKIGSFVFQPPIDSSPEITPQPPLAYFSPHVKVSAEPEPMVYLTATPWDLRACFYEYCRFSTQPLRANTFFVRVPFALLQLISGANAQEMILHAIANQWLETLALNLYTFTLLRFDAREVLGRLLHWHCGSPQGIRHALLRAFDCFHPGEAERTWAGSCDYLVREITKELGQAARSEPSLAELETWAALRPRNTVATSISITSVNLPASSSAAILPATLNSLFDLTEWLKDLQIGLRCFLTIPEKEWLPLNVNQYTLAHAKEDLIRICNDRIWTCSDYQVESLDFLFDPHAPPAAEDILAEKADHSVGRMVQLGQHLLARHIELHPDEPYLNIKELTAL